MIAARNTQVYRPKKFEYGKDREPVRRSGEKRNDKVRSSPSPKDWRESNDYRAKYFERNHGIGGYGYVCSQCWKPMFRKAKIQVDHIIPPSKFARNKQIKGEWVKTSVMARFFNNTFNCAAICPECNGKKSNKVNLQILHGYAMKSVEVLYGLSQLAISVPFMTVVTGLWLTRKIVVGMLSLSSGNKGKRRRTKRR